MLGKWVGEQRLRKLRRAVRHGRVTILCLVLTVVVLRGTIGAGKFGTPEQDLIEIRNRFYHSRKRADPHHRLLEELRAKPSERERKPDPDPIEHRALALGPKVVSDWNERRSQWLTLRNPKKPRVVMVTGSSAQPCASPVGERYLRRSVENKVDYGRIHGFEVLHGAAVLAAEMAGLRDRVRLVRSLLLSRPEVEFLWWIDSDAVFADMAFEVPWERYKDHNLVVHGRSWVGLESGSFMIRNCKWSLNILDAWIGDDNDPPVMAAAERAKWGDKVYLENEYCLESHGGFGDERRFPLLVSHFGRCKPCGNGDDYPDEMCLKAMDRGFDFLSNQVVGMQR